MDGNHAVATPDGAGSSSLAILSDHATCSRQNPVAAPYQPGLPSRNTSSAAVYQAGLSHRYFHSRRIRKGEIERPWTKTKDPREKWVTIIPIIGLFTGLGVAGFFVWDGLRSVVPHRYCPVFIDDFSGGFNESVWTKRAEVGGFGNGQFEETTVTNENVFLQDNMLYIRPSLQDRNLIEHNSIINLTRTGICSSTLSSDCVAGTNTTNNTIVNPVKSGRIDTKKGAVIRYGKVEVEAKLPAGDWLWPAIWLLPRQQHLRALAAEWGDRHHRISREQPYLCTRVLYTNFNQPLWKRGNFPLSDANGTRLEDPWSQTGHAATLFDQDFYLIINVAVGGTNGWFQDGLSGKPWVDQSPTARRDFWNAQTEWYPTWESHGHMIVKSVKMWQQQGYHSC